MGQQALVRENVKTAVVVVVTMVKFVRRSVITLPNTSFGRGVVVLLLQLSLLSLKQC
jgi:hypothetical protein